MEALTILPQRTPRLRLLRKSHVAGAEWLAEIVRIKVLACLLFVSKRTLGRLHRMNRITGASLRLFVVMETGSFSFAEAVVTGKMFGSAGNEHVCLRVGLCSRQTERTQSRQLRPRRLSWHDLNQGLVFI